MTEYSGKKLVVFGDSIINGSGNNGYGIGEYLRDEFGFELFKYCVGGARVGYHEGKSWIIEQVREAIENKISADYIVFDGFTNDCNRTDGVNCDVALGEKPKQIPDIFFVKKENAPFTLCFEALASALKKYFPDAKIIFVRPHNMGRRDSELQKIYGGRALEICNAFGITVADIYSDSGLNTFLPEDRDKYTADTYGWGMGDCTHPNDSGYREKYMPIIKEKMRSL